MTAPRLTPRTEAEVLELLGAYRERRMRVLGALHSWSEIAAGDDLVLDLRHFRELCVRETLDGATVTAGAGATIGEILAALARHGRTLPTVGAITRQTIAGSLHRLAADGESPRGPGLTRAQHQAAVSSSRAARTSRQVSPSLNHAATGARMAWASSARPAATATLARSRAARSSRVRAA
jgi:FAD binding domain